MDEKQYQEFKYIAQQCKSGEYRSINVGSKIRRDAIVAAWRELNDLRAALRELITAADPKTNMSMIPLLDALGRAHSVLDHHCAVVDAKRCSP